MAWIVETLDATVDAELKALPDDMLARFWHISNLIQTLGLERVHGPHIDHIEGRLWEMRLKGRAGIARGIWHCDERRQ